jgi:hypothetical protein
VNTISGFGFNFLLRSSIEQFGDSPERSVLIGPIQVVARGYNILNSESKAAISSIYFLHRPHPHPEDLSSLVGRLNRFGLAVFDALSPALDSSDSVGEAARVMRRTAAGILYGGFAASSSYTVLPSRYKAQFAWDMLTQLWQVVGRGIRGGCPVFVGFVDCAFAPRSFDGECDDQVSSALVQAIRQLKNVCDDPKEGQLASLLYKPFFDALKNTEGLHYGED